MKAAGGIHGAFEADARVIDLMGVGRLRDEAAHEVVGDQEGQQLLVRHGGRTAAQLLHAHRGLHVPKAQFHVPSSMIHPRDLFGGISRWLQQRGGQPQLAGAKPLGAEADVDDPNGDRVGHGGPRKGKRAKTV